MQSDQILWTFWAIFCRTNMAWIVISLFSFKNILSFLNFLKRMSLAEIRVDNFARTNLVSALFPSFFQLGRHFFPATFFFATTDSFFFVFESRQIRRSDCSFISKFNEVETKRKHLPYGSKTWLTRYYVGKHLQYGLYIDSNVSYRGSPYS